MRTCYGCTLLLLTVILVAHCELLAAFCTACGQYTATILGSHTLAEAMLVGPAAIVWLECTFHLDMFLSVFVSTIGLQRYALFFDTQSFLAKI